MKCSNIFYIILTAGFFVNCAQNSGTNKTSLTNQSSVDTLGSINSYDNDSSDPTLDDTDTASVFKPMICSDLSFKQVSWPKGTDEMVATTFGLAMNISGSFEGHTGWTNISNNFDGQGLSLGLFNQNFGQGSLQPLMIALRQNHLSAMKHFFTSSQFSSVDSMLAKWNGGALKSAQNKALKMNLNFYENTTSPLDDPELLAQAGELPLVQKATSKNQASVNWAVSTLYSGSKFKTAWQKALQAMAASPEYVSLQIEAAKYIHNKAMGYMKKFNLNELRSYLFFFDIIVQNGSVTTSIENKYISWEKSHKSASELIKMKQLLEYRLTLVKAQYRNDVRSRKLAVLDGTGTVHGSKRDFVKEYCAPSWQTEFQDLTTLQ
ncbi:MAG: hypothetical protein H6623_02310 [Bdellovibrionaceae bacterium]|nr:hypothetical protein [Pseudobdellovibrionaceae bacterium]